MPVRHQIVKNLLREESLNQVIIVVLHAKNNIVLIVQNHGTMVHANLISNMMNNFYALLRKNSSKHAQDVVNWFKKFQDAIILLVFVNFNFVIFAKKIIEINVNASICLLASIVF